jgi:hypothetical protein
MEFDAIAACFRHAKAKLNRIGGSELPTLTIGEHEAVADIVLLATDIVNMFPLARRDTAVVLDREVIMEEVELMVQGEDRAD